ncbi:MAG: hypothetical protein E7446_07020 [Ruminococcaceae bacterium]|nr:hypothetical protein [Oscillospiraceae bacterium]
MIEIRAVIDDIDYESLTEFLLPIIADKLEEKGGFRALIAKSTDSLSGFAKQMIASMPQEKKDELLLQLLHEKKSLVLDKVNDKAKDYEIGVRILDIDARNI